MAAEIAWAPDVFARAALDDHREPLPRLDFAGLRSIYTIARGSSDAAATIVSCEMMRERHIPVTSLPPSVLSLGGGVRLNGAGVLMISQSGASQDLVLCAKSVVFQGPPLVAITNRHGSPVESAADVTLPIAAGPELAVPGDLARPLGPV